MKMSDVRVGMRLRPTPPGDHPCEQEAVVTKLTERGFKYSIMGPYPLIPRWGLSVGQRGHEHFGINGEALYEEIRDGAGTLV